MATSPAVRVASARDVLAFADKFEPGAREAILSTFPAEALRAFHDSSRMAWLPLDQHHWMVDGMVRHFGRQGAIRCWSASVADVVEKPLLRHFVSAMLRLLGREPPRTIDLLPRAWPLVYQDVCEVEAIHDEPTQSWVLFKNIAPQVHAYPNYFVSWIGLLHGLLALAEVQGEVLLDIPAAAREGRARIRWEPNQRASRPV
jgi:hypothetical protein